MKPVDRLDCYVGRRVRDVRLQRRLSIRGVAAGIGASEQEMRAFEAGTVRIGVLRLGKLAQVLDVPVSAFFAPCFDATFGDDGGAVRRIRPVGSRSVH
jgi:transcriptional regulator with XRE-family HTH domain